jgi:hypothetical protein
MRQPADEFKNGVKYAREAIIKFIEQHTEGDREFLTITELAKEIRHWESQDKEYHMRDFASGEIIIAVRGKVVRISEEANV